MGVQSISSSFPCPLNSTSTTCTLFAAADPSWEALASFVGVDMSTFERLPVVNPVCSPSLLALCLMAILLGARCFSRSKAKAALWNTLWKTLLKGLSHMILAAQLMRYQVIPGASLSSSQLLDGISYSTALPNEYLTVR